MKTEFLLMQGGLKNAQIRGGDGLVPGSHGETPKPRGRGRPCPFLESSLLLLPAGFLLVAAGVGLGQPVITQQPQCCTNIAGTTATFTVQASGKLPLAYQWQYDNWVGSSYFYDRTDCTDTNLVLTDVSSADALDYRVIVTNVDGAVTSEVATLTVILPLTNVKVTPTNSSVSLGANLTLRVTASGTTPFNYQWCLNCTPLPGRTNSTLALTNIQLADGGSYTVVVTNFAGGATSGVVSVQVDPTFTKITTGPLVTDLANWRGGSWGDYSNDGYPDLYFHQRDSTRDLLYRNNGDGTFTRIIEPTLQQHRDYGAWGPAWGDYDNDGLLDLFIAWHYGKNCLFLNRGNGSFQQITTLPAGDGDVSSTAVWGDYDGDGYLDLFVANGGLAGQSAANWLYHNNGNGSFTKIGANQVGSMVSEVQLWNLVGWVDYDQTGTLSLYLPNGPGTRLYRYLGAGRFASVTNPPACNASFAWGDYDNDGQVDLFSASGEENLASALYHNEGSGHFKQMTAAQVGSLVTDKGVAGGVAWGDYDNDGYLDLFVARGWWVQNGNARQTSLLYHNNGDGTFTKTATGSPANDLGQALMANWVDYDRDGFLDLFVSEMGWTAPAPHRLYRNNGNSNNWLCVTCVGTASPRDGTGAKVRALATIRGKPMWQLRLINSGGTCWGGQSFVAHFGLGNATNVDVLRIEWSSGTVQELYNVPAKQYLTVTEPTRLTMPSFGELRIQCWKGMAYRIEGSPDLSVWTPLATVANLTGKLQWTDPGAPGPSARFYRAASVP
jgi:enediyne biosynthesis protein E4